MMNKSIFNKIRFKQNLSRSLEISQCNLNYKHSKSIEESNLLSQKLPLLLNTLAKAQYKVVRDADEKYGCLVWRSDPELLQQVIKEMDEDAGIKKAEAVIVALKYQINLLNLPYRMEIVELNQLHIKLLKEAEKQD